ncbi:MAG: spore germination protein [Oscillospiraceae bacterium]|nr:spore germination protein [Oscillospiraceae bacterium]
MIPYHPPDAGSRGEAPGAGLIKDMFRDAADFAYRELNIGGAAVTLFYIDGLVSSQFVADEIIKPLCLTESRGSPEALLSALWDGVVFGHSVKRRDTLGETADDMLAGSVAVTAGGAPWCLTFEAKGFPSRGVSEPGGESIFKGAKDGFIENLRTNTALVRRKIKNPALRFFETTVGRQTQTAVSVVWIEGLTDPALVDSVRGRLEALDIDALLYASQLEERVADNKWTAFPQMLASERADRFAHYVSAGRVGILIDGLPIGYAAPGTFAELLRAPEDYSQNYLMASVVTLLRYACLLISLTLPAFYLSLVCRHQEIIPTALAQSIIAAKQDVPLMGAFEVLGMLAAFEILLEAGMRLPKPIGQTVSIVGALVVGQAAVEAKFVSPAVVIVIAMTGIAGFTSPNQDLSAAIRVWRIALTVLAAPLGLFGLCIGCVWLLFHLTGVESFGVSYLSPFERSSRDTLTRALFRAPLRLNRFRERALNTLNKRNQP